MSAAFIVSAYYFLVFLSMGIVLPFFALWFVSIGLSDQQIGWVAATPSFLVILINVFIGSLADRAKDWRTTIIVGHWTVAILVSCLFLSQQFEAVWAIWALSGALLLSISPVLDAASLRMARHRGLPFHRIRSAGSLGFIAGVLGGGLIFDQFGITWFLPVFAGIAWVRAGASLCLPKFREGLDDHHTEAVRNDSAHTHPTHPDSSGRSILRDPYFIMVLLGAALINGSHGYYYSFGTILWQDSGYTERVISLFWAVGVLTEVLIMWWFTRIANRFSARKLMVFAGLVATLRWIALTFEPNTVLLLLAQSLHGVTFGVLFLATVNFIANWTSHEIAATTQSFAAMLTTASIAVITAVSGWIYSATGFYGYGVMGAVSLTGSVLVLVALGSRSRFS